MATTGDPIYRLREAISMGRSRWVEKQGSFEERAEALAVRVREDPFLYRAVRESVADGQHSFEIRSGLLNRLAGWAPTEMLAAAIRLVPGFECTYYSPGRHTRPKIVVRWKDPDKIIPKEF